MSQFQLFGLAGLCLLTSCSPYVYNTEITNFSNGVNSVTSSYDTGQITVANLAAQAEQQNEAKAHAKLDVLPGCDNVDGTGSPPKFPPCAVVKFGTSAPPPPTAEEASLAKAAPAFAALKTYATALAAITNAADDATLTTAAQNFATSATNLTTTTANLVPGASTDNAEITAGGAMFGALATAYLDSRRLAILRVQVPSVDSSIAALGNVVVAALLDIRAIQVRQMESQIKADVAPFQLDTVTNLKANDYQGGLSALETEVTAFNTTRAADPVTTVTAMVNAHHQLAQALRSNAGQVEAVYTAAQNFSKAASQMQGALSASASSPASGP